MGVGLVLHSPPPTVPHHQKLGVYQSLRGFRWRPLNDEDLLWAPRIQWAIVALDKEGGLPLRKKTRCVFVLLFWFWFSLGGFMGPFLAFIMSTARLTYTHDNTTHTVRHT